MVGVNEAIQEEDRNRVAADDDMTAPCIGRHINFAINANQVEKSN